jgi:hypothetical protein
MKHLKTFKIFENFDYFSNFIKDFNSNIKGYVTLRWLGESNGYYSEEMHFVKSTDIIESYEDLIKLLYSK